MSREIRSISQSPGETFPEMSQAPAPLGFPEQRLGVESSSVEGAGMYCLRATLELQELRRMAKVMGVESVATGLSCRTGAGRGQLHSCRIRQGTCSIRDRVISQV